MGRAATPVTSVRTRPAFPELAILYRITSGDLAYPMRLSAVVAEMLKP